MACDLTTVLAEACASGVGKLQSKTELLQAWAQLLCSGASPVESSQIILDDGINPPTIISNPSGPYDFTGEAWESITVIGGAAITILLASNNPALTSFTIIDTPAFGSLTLVNTSIVTLDLSAQTAFNELNITDNPLLTTVDLGLLNHTDSHLVITDNDVLVNLDLLSLVFVSGDFSLFGNSILVSLAFPSLTYFSGGMDIYGCTLLETLDISALDDQASGGVGLQLNGGGLTNLETITLPPLWPFAESFQVALAGCALDQATVDGILALALAASVPLTDTTIALEGGTNADPSAQGVSDALDLISAGNTVTFNGSISLSEDDFESYTAGDDLSVCNGGSGWVASYVSRSPLYVTEDDFESYSAAAALDGLNGGTNWSAAYASRP